MGLRNLTFRTVEVQTSGGSFAVRGLSLDNFLTLFYRHGENLARPFDTVVEKVQKQEPLLADDVTLVALKLLSDAPQIVAEVIALASGSDASNMEEFLGDVGVARALEAAIQIDALEKIAAQTFTSDMPPGKIFALVQKAMQAGTSAAGSLPATS